MDSGTKVPTNCAANGGGEMSTPALRSDGPMDVGTLRSRIGAWLHLPAEDLDLIDVTLAVYKSNEMPGDPLWLLTIDASGGGKTETLRPLRARADAYFLSNLTDKTLISGYRDPNHPERDPSLLPKLNGKVLIIKDLSPLLSMRRESRNAILADFRDAYDGFTDQGRGNVGHVHYSSRFSVLAASTMAVERFDAIDGELGERFVKFRVRSNESANKTRQAIRNMGRDDGMRTAIERDICQFLDALPPMQQTLEIPEAFVESLTIIADFTAIARSHVPRDRQHNLRYIPRPEVGTRLGKELAKLFLALAIVRGKPAPNCEELRTVARVAEDSLPPNRLALLRALRSATAGLRISELAGLTGLPRTTVAQVAQDLKVLQLADETCDATAEPLVREPEAVWHLANAWRSRLDGIPLLSV